jgi:hypothetical protein
MFAVRKMSCTPLRQDSRKRGIDGRGVIQVVEHDSRYDDVDAHVRNRDAGKIGAERLDSFWHVGKIEQFGSEESRHASYVLPQYWDGPAAARIE